MTTNADRLKGILDSAAADKRSTLLEHEVYQVLEAAGCAVPKLVFVLKEGSLDAAAIAALGTGRVVLKVVSPEIAHKTDVGGVARVEATVEAIAAARARMLQEVPQRYARLLQQHPSHAAKRYQDLSGAQLERAIREDIRGFLVVEFLACESEGPGSELLVTLRHNREFGPVLTMGVGGIDTELFGAACKKGVSVVTASAVMADADAVLRLFSMTLAYQRVAGMTRGGRRLASDEAVLRVIRAFRALALQFGPESDSWTITELEVNPFGIAAGNLVALDGLLKFGRPTELPLARPIASLDPMMMPSSIGLIGVSAKGMNMGRIILRNMLEFGFDGSRAYVVRPGFEEIDGVRCVPEVKDLPEKVDLFVLAVGAEQVADVLEDLCKHDKATGVILIAGGMGEKEGGQAIEARVKKVIRQAHLDHKSLVVNGGNCLGIVSRPGRYHTLFIPQTKLPLRVDGVSNVAFVSQSGAYMITRMSKLDWLSPRYAVSTGNQIDLTVSDFLRHMASDPEVRTFAVYAEGFADLDGLAAAQAVREITSFGRDVVFYKAGRTSEGKKASSGHTASLAGDYDVCESILDQAGAYVARTFDEFLDLLKVSSLMGGRHWAGNRLAAFSNAGYEAVGIADSVRGEGWNLKLAELSESTRSKLADALKRGKVDALVDVRNPLDVTPMADDATNAEAARILATAPEVDLVLCATVPLSPAMATLAEGVAEEQSISTPGSLVNRLAKLVNETDKPVVAAVDSGSRYDAMCQALQDRGIPTFRSADVAVRTIGLYAAKK